MTRRLLRITLIGLVALVALAGFWPVFSKAVGLNISWVQPSVSQSSVAGACADNGVTLVVDFGSNSKKTPLVKCVKDFNGTGWDLFQAAGVSVSGTDQYPAGFVCRIDGFPAKSQQDCVGTPTRKQGTWAYFNMAAGAKPTWRFSMQGSASRTPTCGSVEGWVFSSTSRPLNHPRVTPNPFECGK